jgi:hypothetical protein
MLRLVMIFGSVFFRFLLIFRGFVLVGLVFVRVGFMVLEFMIVVNASGGSVLGAFLSGFGGEIGAAGGAAGFDFGGLFVAKFRSGPGVRFGSCGVGFVVFFFLVDEFGTANESIRFDFFGGFFVFGLDEVRSESRDLIVAEVLALGGRFGMRSRRLRQFERRRSMPRRIGAMRGNSGVFRYTGVFFGGDGSGLGFGSGIGQKPAGKSAGETARSTAATGSRCGQRGGGTRRDGFDFRFQLDRFAFNDRRRGWRGCGLVAIFCERLAGEEDGFLGGIDWSGRTRAALMVGPAIIKAALFRATRLKAAWLAAAIFITARFTAARFTLRRSVFGGRKIASSARTTLRATTAPTTATAPKATTISTA